MHKPRQSFAALRPDLKVKPMLDSPSVKVKVMHFLGKGHFATKSKLVS